MSTHHDIASRSFFSPLFLLSAITLIAAAIGLRPALAGLEKRFTKQPIAMRRSFDSLDVNGLPSFRHSPDGLIVETTDEEVETEHWCSIAFTPIKAAPIDGFEPTVTTLITYYSDARSQVPHTPEVCYRQSGAVIRSMTTETIEIPGLAPGATDVVVRRLVIEQDEDRLILLYVFVSNGEFLSDRESVRWAIAKPGSRHTYFSKVEAMVHCPPGIDVASMEGYCQLMMQELIPLLMREFYPTREQIRGG